MNGIIINNRVYKLTEFDGDSHTCEDCPLHNDVGKTKLAMNVY